MTSPRHTIPCLSVAAALVLLAGTAHARQPSNTDAPQPVAPEPAPAGAPPAPERTDALGRRIPDGPPTVLGFKNVTVEQIIPFIVEATGKVVMPQQDVMSRKITVVNDRAIPREQALDLVFLALQQNGIAVVENNGTISLRDITEITKQDVPVLGPDESALNRPDLGLIAQKVYGLRYLTAEPVGEALKDIVPDYAKLTVDKESNQVAVMGNIALLRRIERLIDSLDRPSAAAVGTQTFRLRYADAEQIAENIKELFTADDSTGARGAQQGRGRGGNQQFRFPGQPQEPEQSGSTSEDLRVTANTQQNAVTVVAEPAVLSQIRRQIEEFWDLPLPDEAVVPRIYDLKNSDPVKVRDLLEGLFGRGTPSGQAAGGAGGGAQGAGGGGGRGSTGTSQGVGRLAGQFSFQAIPEAGRLVVVSKSPDNLAVIDKIIEGLDLPQTVGLPAIVELKHASSEDLAEQLNTLLAQDGTLAQIRRSASGLSEESSTASPFAETTTTGLGEQDQATPADSISFWWQRSRPPTDSRGASNLIAQIRIVPVWRQNALMVLAPPEYKNSIVQLIGDLDKPGRQVLISAIVAEISGVDASALGIRWSSSTITPTDADNTLSIGSSATGTQNNFLDSLFDTSVLNVGTNLNVLLQALAEKTDVSILSEPRVFTSDNQEAEFFDGQDIPFITESQPNTQGNLLQSFDYKAVGISLRVRPRITMRRDVDLRVNLELSSITPGATLFGGAIIDRRETTTQLIVQDGQTIVISGIRRSELSDIVRKVPFLGDIPLLGALFRSTEKSRVDSELVVFITPVVIDNDLESEQVNTPYRLWLEGHQKQMGSGRDPGEAPPLPPPLLPTPAPAGEPDPVPTGPEPDIGASE